MRERVEHYRDVISGIVFMYESEHGEIEPLITQITYQLIRSILGKEPEKFIQSKINYLHKSNRLKELKGVLVELYKETN